MHARTQLALGIGFCQKAVGAQLEPFEPDLVGGAPGDEEHRNRLRARYATKRLQQLDAAEARHHDVGDDEIRASLQYVAEGILSVVRRLHVELVGQDAGQMVP